MRLSTKMYNKIDDFSFLVANCFYLDGDVPLTFSDDVYIFKCPFFGSGAIDFMNAILGKKKL